MLIFILPVAAGVSLRNIDNLNRKEIVFYYMKKNMAILINNGTKGYIFTDDDSLLISPEYKFNLKNDLIKKGISSPVLIYYTNQKEFIPLDSSFYYHYPFLSYHNQNIYFLDKETRNDSVIDPLLINYVLITQNPYLKIDSVNNKFGNAIYLIDNNNLWKSNNYWVREFGNQGIPVYSVKGDGVFVINSW